jgi:hypothetical protein
MIVKTYLPVLLFLITNFTVLFSQTFTVPAVGLKSHQTMEVLRIELSPEKTVVLLSIENRIKGGTFCADRNIYIVQPDGSRLKLQKASGIPQCPDSHKFSREGEVLEFSLTFGSLKPGTGWIDIVEECGQDCFSVYGILLNESFSRRIDDALFYVNKGQTDSAIGLYRKMIQDAGDNEAGIVGSLYTDLISLLVSKGYGASAAETYRKLVSLDIPRKQFYIDNLNFRGIKY